MKLTLVISNFFHIQALYLKVVKRMNSTESVSMAQAAILCLEPLELMPITEHFR